MRFGELGVVSLDIQVFWDVTLRHWAKNFFTFKSKYNVFLRVPVQPNTTSIYFSIISMTCFGVKHLHQVEQERMHGLCGE